MPTDKKVRVVSSFLCLLLFEFIRFGNPTEEPFDLIAEESISVNVEKSHFKDFPDDLETAEGNIHHASPYGRPFAFGDAIQAEMERLKLLDEVIPPQNISYYRPYGDRTVALLKYPVMTPEIFISYYGGIGYAYSASSGNCTAPPPLPAPQPVILKQHVRVEVEVPPQVDQYGQRLTRDTYVPPPENIFKPPPENVYESPPENAYGPPPETVYGPQPKPTYGPPPVLPTEEPEPQSPPDVGVIVAQSYVFRENVRDYLNMTGFGSGITGKPSKALLSEMVDALAKSYFEDTQKWNPPLNPFYSIYTKAYVLQKRKEPSFVLLHLESYLKTSNDSTRFGFLTGKSYSNGTIYFPREKDPQQMANIPFVLRPNGGIDYIFGLDGYELHDFGTLVKAQTEIKSFVKLVHDIHDRVHREGKKSLERAIKTEDKLEKPRFVNTTADDPAMVRREAAAKMTNWLYTSSIAIRSITYAKKYYKPVDYLQVPEHGHYVHIETPQPEVTYVPELTKMFGS